MPLAHVLFVVICVDGCGWLRLERFLQRDSVSLALWKSAPSSASAAEERTFFVVVDRTWMAPFEGGSACGG